MIVDFKKSKYFLFKVAESRALVSLILAEKSGELWKIKLDKSIQYTIIKKEVIIFENQIAIM